MENNIEILSKKIFNIDVQLKTANEKIYKLKNLENEINILKKRGNGTHIINNILKKEKFIEKNINNTESELIKIKNKAENDLNMTIKYIQWCGVFTIIINIIITFSIKFI